MAPDSGRWQGWQSLAHPVHWCSKFVENEPMNLWESLQGASFSVLMFPSSLQNKFSKMQTCATLSCVYKEPSPLSPLLFRPCSGQPSALWRHVVQASRAAQVGCYWPLLGTDAPRPPSAWRSLYLVHLSISLLVTEDLAPSPTQSNSFTCSVEFFT